MENPDKVFSQFGKIVGPARVREIKKEAKKLAGKHIVAVSSTFQGGGVAEMLHSLVYLFDELGLDFGWRILPGTQDFFNITKKIHNTLQGQGGSLSSAEKKIYEKTSRDFSRYTHLKYHDLVIVHDPQPLPLINCYPKKKQPWIWRGHIDLSKPNSSVWRYVSRFINKYDHLVLTCPKYRQPDLRKPVSYFAPVIDPLSPKNRAISDEKAKYYLKKYGVRLDKPLISQVSRFDKWKDPIGVVKVFELVRKKKDCRLILLGNFATDDPEAGQELVKLEKAVKKSPYHKDIYILTARDGDNDWLVNAVQKLSAVVIQKSQKEGFGLTATEAMFKGTPVVASEIGGIPLQIKHGENGFLAPPRAYSQFADHIIHLLDNERGRKKIGQAARQTVKEKFLITRLLLDWLKLFNQYLTK